MNDDKIVGLGVLICFLTLVGTIIFLIYMIDQDPLLPQIPKNVALALENYYIPEDENLDEWLHEVACGLLKVGLECKNVGAMADLAKKLNHSIEIRDFRMFKDAVFQAYKTHMITFIPIFRDLIFRPNWCHLDNGFSAYGIIDYVLKDLKAEMKRKKEKEREEQLRSEILANKLEYEIYCEEFGC